MRVLKWGRREAEETESERASLEALDQPLLALDMELGHKQRNAGSLYKLERARKGFSHRTSRRECSPAHALSLDQGDLFQTSALQNYNIINLRCFK